MSCPPSLAFNLFSIPQPPQPWPKVSHTTFIPEKESKLLSMASETFTSLTSEAELSMISMMTAEEGSSEETLPAFTERALASYMPFLICGPHHPEQGDTCISPPICKHMVFYQQGSFANLVIM